MQPARRTERQRYAGLRFTWRRDDAGLVGSFDKSSRHRDIGIALILERHGCALQLEMIATPRQALRKVTPVRTDDGTRTIVGAWCEHVRFSSDQPLACRTNAREAVGGTRLDQD